MRPPDLGRGAGAAGLGRSRFRPVSACPRPAAAAEFATRQIQKVGAAARDAKRVEVPFEFISPPAGAYWTHDSRAGIDVPLGKAGATKRQHFTLGHGTSQHVLIAGRTGSGKSTLMHALITNLALNYSPDEIDLYLIDFKKGVEFKVYATYELPHASVVAIESEREFGISVLERLDAELRLRADRFRDAGVQDLAGYRNARHAAPAPHSADRRRIPGVLQRGRQARPGSGLLARPPGPPGPSLRNPHHPRLAEPGRGIHSGAQHPGPDGGAHRPSVQRKRRPPDPERKQHRAADALAPRRGDLQRRQRGARGEPLLPGRLALGRAPRGLSQGAPRPGAKRKSRSCARTPIVFEGDAPADLARNPMLRERLEAPSWPESPRSAQAWVGEAISIKDPTSALFRRQGGNNLLIVGQNDEAALGVSVARS